MNESQTIEIENNECQISTVEIEKCCELCGYTSRDLINLDNPPSINYTQSLCEYEDNLNDISKINRIAINLLEIQQLYFIAKQNTALLGASVRCFEVAGELGFA